LNLKDGDLNAGGTIRVEHRGCLSAGTGIVHSLGDGE